MKITQSLHLYVGAKYMNGCLHVAAKGVLDSLNVMAAA